MANKDAKEFSYNEKTGLYRKKVKNPNSGKWVPVYGHTKQEVRDKMREKSQLFSEAAAAETRPFVYQYAAKWYALNTSGLQENTRSAIANVINNHICPVIGNKLMCEVSLDDGKAVMLAASDLSKSTQQKILSVLKRIFRDASDNEIISKLPFSTLKATGRKTAEKIPLTEAQQETLIRAVAGTPAYLFVMLALYTGMRREEILGLKLDCVHLEADPPYISVRRSLTWKNNRPIISEQLKSDAARRDIPIPNTLADALNAIQTKPADECVICDSKRKPMSNQSFKILWQAIEARTVHEITVKDSNGKPQTVLLKVGDKIRKHNITVMIDFNVTPHILRHTYITRLILSGANLKTVQYLAGHATAQMILNIYSHLIDKQPQDTVSAVYGAYNSGSKTGANSDY